MARVYPRAREWVVEFARIRRTNAHIPAMHLLSAKNRDEFLSCPQLVRLAFPEGADGHEPTLLVKASSLLLRYIISGSEIRLIFSALPGHRLLYALKIIDDEEHPATLWSIMERSEERAALEALSGGAPLQVFLFNELAICVAWAEMELASFPARIWTLAGRAKLGKIEHNQFAKAASAIFDRVHMARQAPINIDLIGLTNSTEWKITQNSYITNQAGASQLELDHHNEGSQQEELIIWLTDNLQPTGAIHSPQIQKGVRTRELTDILLTHQYGSMLFESKALAVLARPRKPNRAKLTNDIVKHVMKAANQLRGAARSLKNGVPIFDTAGQLLDVERTQPPHTIILVPDLDLLRADPRLGVKFMHDYYEDSGAILHVLDPAELLRIVQAAQFLARKKNASATAIEAFDYFLMKRAERTVEARHLCISVIHHFDVA